jgi:outer membrane receptor protein involved in Fe transport
MKTPCACAVLLPLALTLEAFTVTGSNIRRVEAETAVPVMVVDAAEMLARGASTMADFIETLGMAEISGVTEIGAGAQTAKGDAALVDLRGMGSGSTLVLLNGRRMAPHAISMAENGVPSLAPSINAVPRALVSRVEILRDGASAIYGADAAAGVDQQLRVAHLRRARSHPPDVRHPARWRRVRRASPPTTASSGRHAPGGFLRPFPARRPRLSRPEFLPQ